MIHKKSHLTNQELQDQSCQSFLDRLDIKITDYSPDEFINLCEVIHSHTDYDVETFYEAVEYLAKKVKECHCERFHKEWVREHLIESEKEDYLRDRLYGRN